ncbi:MULTISPECIES: DUF6153 family protein [unclassified Leucobacter]|uniref:DUF6153 family protein n=1 Tax=unclassified Leucobacter TaxID=2621730 RepID=UPI00117A806B|nr:MULTISPECIES: DUF6153 family protein [unclassified Leucobacter]
MSNRHERVPRGSLGRFLAVGAILLGLIGMHSLLLADPANHGSAPAAAAGAAIDALEPAVPGSAESATPADAPHADSGTRLSPQGGEHADLIAACVLALLLTAVLLLASDRRLLARFTAGIGGSRPRLPVPGWPALRTSPAVLAVSRT